MADKTNFVAPATTERTIPNAFACPVSQSVYLMCNIPAHGRMHRRFRYAEIIHVKNHSHYDACTVTTTEGAYTIIHFTSGVKNLETIFSLNSWESLLPGKHFIRICRKTIVNANSISAVGTSAIMVDGTWLKLPRTQKDTLDKFLRFIKRSKLYRQ